MRVLRFLGLIAAICCFTGLAGATPVDFHMQVLDPPPSFNVQPIFSTPFNFSFTTCSVGELPSGTADGCFAGVNRTGQDWNNLQITFADNAVLAGQTPNCALTNPNNTFGSSDCSLVDSTYILTFSGGQGIANGAFFFITEDGVVPPEGFGVGTGAVLTPEPGSIVLLSTGALLFGWLLYGERLRALRLSQLS